MRFAACAAAAALAPRFPWARSPYQSLQLGPAPSPARSPGTSAGSAAAAGTRSAWLGAALPPPPWLSSSRQGVGAGASSSSPSLQQQLHCCLLPVAKLTNARVSPDRRAIGAGRHCASSPSAALRRASSCDGCANPNSSAPAPLPALPACCWHTGSAASPRQPKGMHSRCVTPGACASICCTSDQAAAAASAAPLSRLACSGCPRASAAPAAHACGSCRCSVVGPSAGGRQGCMHGVLGAAESGVVGLPKGGGAPAPRTATLALAPGNSHGTPRSGPHLLRRWRRPR